jgi:replicative DNA helicase
MGVLASNVTAEQGVISCLLLDPDVVTRCNLEPEHFVNETYRKMWVSAVQSYRDGIPYTFADAVTDGANLDELMALQAVSPSPYNLPSYVENVKEAYERRRAQLLSAKIMELASDPEKDIEEVRQLASAFATSGSHEHEAVTTWESVSSQFEADMEYYRDVRGRGMVPDFPWASWNAMLGDPEVGMLVFLAAAESTGKTVFAEMIAEHWAKRGLRVGFFHHELHGRIMRRRRYARQTGISEAVLKTGVLTEAQEHLRKEADYVFSQWTGGIDYIHAPGWTMDRILRTSEVLGLNAIVIDYIQKVQPTAAQQRSSKGDITRWGPMAVEDLKNYCERTETYAVTLSQINAEGKKNGEPSMADIRWWKELSEKANMGIIAWREISEHGERVGGKLVTNPGSKSIYVHVKVDKNTMGPTGRLPNQQIEGARFRILDTKGAA